MFIEIVVLLRDRSCQYHLYSIHSLSLSVLFKVAITERINCKAELGTEDFFHNC